MFYLGLGYSKMCQKRSSVSSVLQPIVAVRKIMGVMQNKGAQS